MPYTDPQKQREASRRWYARNREREAAKHKKWHEENRERSREIGREYYATNKDAVLARTNQWHRDNADKHRAYAIQNEHKRRAVITNMDGMNEWVEALKGDPCSYCGKPMEELDHIDALSRGGEHSWTNLTAACKKCNGSKFTKTLLESLLCR